HTQDGARLRAEGHADADLASAPSNGIRFHAVEADDGQTEGESAEDGEHGGAGANNPKLEVALEMLGETLERENRQRWIHFAHGPAQQIRGRAFAAWRGRAEADEEGNVALEATRKGKVDLAVRIFFEKLLFGGRNDPDDLDRFFPGFGAEVAGHADTFAVVFRFRRIVAGVLDALAERVTFRPKFFRQDFVDDRDDRAAWLGRLGLSENAAAHDRQTNGREIIGADAVPGGIEGEAFRGRGRFRVGRGLQTRALKIAAQRNHSERDRSGDVGVLEGR